MWHAHVCKIFPPRAPELLMVNLCSTFAVWTWVYAQLISANRSITIPLPGTLK
jgi:hypothetical protein